MHIFYDLSKFTTLQLRKFFKYCVYKSYDTHMEHIPNNSWTRKKYDDISIGTFIDKFITSKTHNVFIHRVRPDENYIEAGVRTLNDIDIFLYVFINIKELNEIVDKFKLKVLE